MTYDGPDRRLKAPFKYGLSAALPSLDPDGEPMPPVKGTVTEVNHSERSITIDCDVDHETPE